MILFVGEVVIDLSTRSEPAARRAEECCWGCTYHNVIDHPFSSTSKRLNSSNHLRGERAHCAMKIARTMNAETESMHKIVVKTDAHFPSASQLSSFTLKHVKQHNLSSHLKRNRTSFEQEQIPSTGTTSHVQCIGFSAPIQNLHHMRTYVLLDDACE